VAAAPVRKVRRWRQGHSVIRLKDPVPSQVPRASSTPLITLAVLPQRGLLTRRLSDNPLEDVPDQGRVSATRGEFVAEAFVPQMKKPRREAGACPTSVPPRSGCSPDFADAHPGYDRDQSR
jgi:hypothetical protein